MQNLKQCTRSGLIYFCSFLENNQKGVDGQGDSDDSACMGSSETQTGDETMPMTIEARREVVRLAGLDVEEFGDADSLEALRRAEQRLDEAIQAAEAAGEYRWIEP